MSQHIGEWLDAYIDGELSAEHQGRIEAHLEECGECRAQVESRQSLSLLLQAAPPAANLKLESRFVSEIGLQMERRKALPRAHSGWLAQAWKVGWYLIPVGTLLVILFVQTAVWISGVVELIPGAEQVLQVQASVPQPVSGMFSAIDLLAVPGAGWLSGLIVLAVSCLIYLSWLASWWVRNQQAASN